MDIFRLREQFSADGIVMCFNGPFSHSIIEEIGIAIKNHLVAESAARLAVLDVFAVYIEMAQNARNYLQRKNIPLADAGSATIVIAKRGERYAVTSGNVVHKTDTPELLGRIDHINTLDTESLKKLIWRQLRSELPAYSIGAGIGLMEIARRRSDKLEYSVRDIDGEHDFFALTVQV